MRTDLSQYYHSTKPSVRLSYITSEAEKVNFTINGQALLLRDFNVFATTKTNHRETLQQLKEMAMQNNTTGASIYDLGNVIKSNSIAEVSDILKDAETKTQQQREQEMQQQQKMQEQQIQAQQQQAQEQRQFEQSQQEAEIQKDITVAEIRAAGFGAQSDVNENNESDFTDAMKDMRQRDEYREQMNFKKEESSIKNSNARAKMDIDREKINVQREIADKNLAIARENKNKYDVKPKKKDKKK